MTLTLSNHKSCRFLVTFNYGLFKKKTLKKIREAASKHESLSRKLGLLRKQLTTAEPGDRSQGIADQIELSELEQAELCLSLVEFRSEARELANVDGVQLNAEQLREDVK